MSKHQDMYERFRKVDRKGTYKILTRLLDRAKTEISLLASDKDFIAQASSFDENRSIEVQSWISEIVDETSDHSKEATALLNLCRLKKVISSIENTDFLSLVKNSLGLVFVVKTPSSKSSYYHWLISGAIPSWIKSQIMESITIPTGKGTIGWLEKRGHSSSKLGLALGNTFLDPRGGVASEDLLCGARSAFLVPVFDMSEHSDQYIGTVFWFSPIMGLFGSKRDENHFTESLCNSLETVLNDVREELIATLKFEKLNQAVVRLINHGSNFPQPEIDKNVSIYSPLLDALAQNARDVSEMKLIDRVASYRYDGKVQDFRGLEHEYDSIIEKTKIADLFLSGCDGGDKPSVLGSILKERFSIPSSKTDQWYFSFPNNVDSLSFNGDLFALPINSIPESEFQTFRNDLQNKYDCFTTKLAKLISAFEKAIDGFKNESGSSEVVKLLIEAERFTVDELHNIFLERAGLFQNENRFNDSSNYFSKVLNIILNKTKGNLARNFEVKSIIKLYKEFEITTKKINRIPLKVIGSTLRVATSRFSLPIEKFDEIDLDEDIKHAVFNLIRIHGKYPKVEVELFFPGVSLDLSASIQKMMEEDDAEEIGGIIVSSRLCSNEIKDLLCDVCDDQNYNQNSVTKNFFGDNASKNENWDDVFRLGTNFSIKAKYNSITIQHDFALKLAENLFQNSCLAYRDELNRYLYASDVHAKIVLSEEDRFELDKISESLDPVFIFGNLGSGKEFTARYVHSQSQVHMQEIVASGVANSGSHTFLHINCAGLTDVEFQQALFGRVKNYDVNAGDHILGGLIDNILGINQYKMSKTPEGFYDYLEFCVADSGDKLEKSREHWENSALSCELDTKIKSYRFRWLDFSYNQANSKPVGTIYLSNIQDLKPLSQGKLLQYLETHQFRPLGWHGYPFQVNARVICSSRVSLEALKEKDGFRSDLFYRLSERKFIIPSIRNRISSFNKRDLEEFLDKILNEKGKLKSQVQQYDRIELTQTSIGYIKSLLRPYQGSNGSPKADGCSICTHNKVCSVKWRDNSEMERYESFNKELKRGDLSQLRQILGKASLNAAKMKSSDEVVSILKICPKHISHAITDLEYDKTHGVEL